MTQEGRLLIHAKMKREEKGAHPLTEELVTALQEFPELSNIIIQTSGEWDVITDYQVADNEAFATLLQHVRQLKYVVQCFPLENRKESDSAYS